MRDWKPEKIKPNRDDRGLSLFTVVIAVSFIGILGMLLLYIAVANFQMKTTDLRGKDSFYTAEQALEEIRTGLQEDVGKAMSKAYVTTMETYNDNSRTETTEATLDELRQSIFKENYVKELAKSLQDTPGEEAAGTSYYSLTRLKGYVDTLKDEERFGADGRESLVVTNPSGKAPVMEKSMSAGVALRNLKVIYVDGKGNASVIETDVRLGVPKIQFPTPSTLPDLMNMIVVAGKGIICEGGVNGNQIQGSIYAGNLDNPNGDVTGTLNQTSIWVQKNGSLSVSNGDKLVCQGEIKVDDMAKFSSAGEVTLWAQGVTLASAQVSLLGKTYLADDLTVEPGTGNTGSTVTIEGEYYGYGSPVSARAEGCHNSERFKDWTDAALNSAIVINGKNTSLDLSGVRKMMLAGKSFVGSSKKTGAKGESNSDVPTGESLTVKGAQLAYLLPAELLEAKSEGTTLHNPMDYEEYLTNIAELEDEQGLKAALLMDTPVAAWGGKTLSQIGADGEKPVTRVFYNQNNSGYVYFYLNFTDGERAAAFMQEYYANNPAVKANMDKYLSFYFPGENQGIRLNSQEALLRYVTGGNVLTYDGGKAEGGLLGATDANAPEELTQEQINYQNMWFALNRKMIGSYDLLNQEVKVGEEVHHDETDPARSVFDNLVHEEELINFIKEKGTEGQPYTFTSEAEDGSLTAVLYDNQGGAEYVIDRADEEKLRLVVCTGDVRIQSGVQFQGIIMTKGKITLEDGASLTSAPLEAARVFQALNNTIGEESRQIFWEGDRYVLGNSDAGEEGSGTGNLTETYDISRAITYENWKKR